MRRMTLMMMALAMVLGFTQCKKDQTVPQDDTEGVRITLIVDGANNNSKVNVDPQGHTNPDYATVTFEAGDVIYVGNNGYYCGYLQHNGTYFVGTIDDTNGALSTSDYLHFYFMGNKGPIGSAPSNVSITDQTGKYPVISYAPSKQLFNSGTTTYTAKLENYCAIVKFTTPDVYGAITITGMNNTVSVNFGAGEPFSFSKTGDGEITLHKVSNTERWAILLPQGEVTTATASAPNYVSENVFTIHEITADMYDNSGVSIPLSKLPYIDADFSVAANETVKFSRGNLQAVFASSGTSDCTWKFADNQYDCIGNATANTNVGDNQVSAAGTVDLFGWVGASGTLDAYGINNSTTDADYGTGSEALKDDWGKLSIESAGGHSWRTLTKDEWVYLFITRVTTSNHRFARANVCGQNGVILLPDNWSDATYTLDNYGSGGAQYTGNTIDATGWTTLEAAGCVFLPAAGYRNGTTVTIGQSNYYWSSTSSSGKNSPYYVKFDGSSVNPDAEGGVKRHNGLSVRLVF